MFTFKQGDLLMDTADALVNPVNCVGVMGAGLAKLFKAHYPENFEAYRLACQNRDVQIGRVFVFKQPSLSTNRYIFNVPTKLHWKDPSRLSYVSDALKDLREKIIQYDVKSIAIPRLGCGHGGLAWPTVRNLILHRLDNLDDVEIKIYSE